jgi:YVTN family beta-propeller protein
MLVRLGILTALFALPREGLAAFPPAYLHAPSVDTYATHAPNGVTILSNGRLLNPVGRHFPLARWPHGLAMSRDGANLFIASSGIGQIVENWQGGSPSIREVVPQAKNRKNRGLSAGGADFSADGGTLFWSSGDGSSIYIVDVKARRITGEIPLNTALDGKSYEDTFVVDVKMSPAGRYLYCADVANFRVIILDVERKEVVGSANVGRYPYALTVSGNTLYVANIGLFEYSAIPAPTDKRFDARGLTKPPFGYPSPEAKEGTYFEGRQIPGLGDPNVPDSFSVWAVDVEDARHPKIAGRVKTGLLVGAPTENGKTVGGSAPNFLVSARDAVFVSNGNNDLIERLELPGAGVLLRKRIVPSTLVEGLRGVSPAGMVLSPSADRLYVAEMGINAIAVFDTRTLEVLGHIPTAWYPYRVGLSPDGKKLACICFRGFGNGPNAGANIPQSEFLAMRGVLSVLDVPSDAQLASLTSQVLTNNGILDQEKHRSALSSPVVSPAPGEPSEQIKYVVFIAKENHTYDTIFDRVPGAKDDPSLLRWGLHQTIREKGQATLENVPVMVNHNALARQFTVSDNFYMEPEASGVGHRWLVGVQPNNLMQMTYTVGWSFRKNSRAPGRRYSMGSNGSLIPEDYPEAGSMFDHLANNQVRFRNYGEGFEFPGVEEEEDERPTGAREVVNVPMPKVLYDNTCFDFPIFNMNIPDQYRAGWFMKDVKKRFLRGFHRMPSFMNIALCSDHGTDPKPDKGYPYLASWMADNDLALGRIIEFLSHTAYWKNMAIFVTQDDSGGEPDHIDAQRSVLLLISPWARRGFVSHRHTTILSMHRTMYEIFGLPPLNMFDALANDFSDCFTSSPDFRPYQCLPVDARIFDPEKAKDPKDPDYGVARRQKSIDRDDDDEMENVLTRAGKEISNH